MYYNVFGEKVSRKRFKAMCAAAKNRRELIAAGLTSRRDLFKMGLLTAGGFLGDKVLVNGTIQPFFNVEPRRYRFRLLDTGPSRFYEFFLTNLTSPGTANPFWLIGTDGNLIPTPIQVQSVRIGPAERVDIIIDFRAFAGKALYLENRLNQLTAAPRIVRTQSPVRLVSNHCSTLF